MQLSILVKCLKSGPNIVIIIMILSIELDRWSPVFGVCLGATKLLFALWSNILELLSTLGSRSHSRRKTNAI